MRPTDTPGNAALPIFETVIEGQPVRCYEHGGVRLWRCGCEAFEGRLTRLGDGFCGHTAVAIAEFQKLNPPR